LLALEEFSDLAKKLQNLEARIEKIDQIAAEVSESFWIEGNLYWNWG